MSSQTSDDRWAAALQIALISSDAGRRGAGLRRVAVAGVGGGLITILIGVVRDLLAPDRDSGTAGGGALPATFWAGVAVAAAGLVLACAGVVWGLVTRHLTLNWNWPDYPLNAREKREARRQILGKEAATEAHMTVLVSLAGVYRRFAIGMVPLTIALVVASAGMVAAVPDIRTVAIFGVCALVLIAMEAHQLVVTYPAAGRFLLDHGGPM